MEDTNTIKEVELRLRKKDKEILTKILKDLDTTIERLEKKKKIILDGLNSLDD